MIRSAGEREHYAHQPQSWHRISRCQPDHQTSGSQRLKKWAVATLDCAANFAIDQPSAFYEFRKFGTRELLVRPCSACGIIGGVLRADGWHQDGIAL